MYMVYYPIYDYEGNKSGMLYGGIDFNMISNLLADISPKNSITWIMDNDYNIISHNKNYFYESVVSKQVIKESMYNKESSSDVINLKKSDNTDATIVYSNIPYTENWKLCTIIDDTNIHAHTQTIITTIILFGIFIIMLSIIIISKQSRKLAKPLEILTANMNNVKNGEFIQIKVSSNIKEVAYLESSYNEMVVKISELIHEIYIQQNISRQSELRALQSQINPHFLYNSLDTIKWMSQDYEDDKIYTMIENLSNFFRISLSDGNEIICVNQELMHTKYYLEILKIRYEDTMDFEIFIEEQIKNCECLKIIIQPLVENALYHGLKNSAHK